MTRRLIATDLDGTIIRSDGKISQRTISAITRAVDNGAQAIVVTGRPTRWLGDVVDSFGTKTIPWAICCNGAMLFDLANDKVLREWEISIETTMEVAKRLRFALPGIGFAMERRDHYVREKHHVPRWDVGLDVVGVDFIEEELNQPFLKLIARSTNGRYDSDEMLSIAAPLLADLATITHSAPEDALLEISALGVDKGSTLAYVAKEWGYGQDEIVVFGDNPNDIPMLAWATHSYAVESGHRDAHSAAKYLAPACNEDGVAQVIESLFSLSSS